MSYSFNVVRDAAGLRVTTSGPSVDQVPEGIFTINGHEPGEGTSKTGSIGVQLVDAEGHYVAGASGSRSIETKEA